MQQSARVRPPAPVGALLQHWRKSRHLSQLELATRAQVSARHLCFVETGRSRPSREMVLLLANTLDVPLRERNALLLAAGFAPLFEESELDAPALATVHGALDAILRQQEPYPAIVMNRHWDIVSGNDAAKRFFAYLLGWSGRPPGANLLRLMLDPVALRPRVRNWNKAAITLFHRIQREATCGVCDERTLALIEELRADAELAALLRDVDPSQPSVPVIPIEFLKAEDEPAFNYFSTVTTLGTPQDVTLQELRIECFFPADHDTARNARGLADTRTSGARPLAVV